MLDLKTGKKLTRRDLLKYASISIGGAALSASGEQFWLPRDNWCRTNSVGSANASVGRAARGMMRGVWAHLAMMSEKKEDNRWAQEVMDKTYPTTDIIEEHHNAKYTEELTKVYGEQQ